VAISAATARLAAVLVGCTLTGMRSRLPDGDAWRGEVSRFRAFEASGLVADESM
jgi:hypothetical protein